MAASPKALEGLEYTRAGIKAYDAQQTNFDKCLTLLWEAKTRARSSTHLDAPECEASFRELMLGRPQSKLKIFFRVLVYIGVIVAAITIKMAFDDDRSTTEIIAFCGVGLLLTVVLFLLQEFLPQR